MIGLGLVELFVILAIGGVFVSMFGFVTFAVIASAFPRGPGPRMLGVCQRLSEQFNLSVGGLRVLFVLATLFTGIVPGVIAYVALALFNGSLDEASAARRPSPNGADGSQLLGICADLADRLDVPANRVRGLVVVATIFTGVFPGLIAYFAAGIVKAYAGPDKWNEWFGASAPRPAAERAPWRSAPMPASDMPGRIGRYRIVGLLGRGGMGSVWRGRDDALGRDAAVKVVDGPFGSEAVRRFGEEARAAAAIQSPHIVQIWEYAPDARPPFLAMEFVPGRSLLQLVRASGPQPAATAIDCAAQILAGLAAAHARGIVHRDIKPANILLATRGPAAGTYKLTDFGLATSPDRQHALTATGTLLGTLSYLAPEVASGDDATPSSDLYSLGATLHELVVGRPPLEAETPLKLLRKLTTEPIQPVASLRPDLPADLAAWLDRLVARAPEARFASAEAALEALRGVAGFAGATTDLDVARSVRADDLLPWHRRPVPGGAESPPPLPTTVPPEVLPHVLGRAMAIEAEGGDALGEESILDIARELNIDSGAVRAALRDRHARSGDGVTGIFRHALGGKEPRPDEPVSIAVEKGARGRGNSWRGAVVGAMMGAFLLPFIVVGVREAPADRAREATARRTNESIREAFESIPSFRGPERATEVVVEKKPASSVAPVSYTHLTLPTILLV